MKKGRGKSRNPESGYALLFIFAMAAILAIGLYKEVPRVAFEAQRDKEQLLIDRGEQYSRAVQLFVHKFNRFPATMEELENTNNMRFLRKRYVDPMTGKSDWRILHAGPGGVLLDSVTTVKKPDATAQQTFITELPFGGNLPSGEGGINLASRLRPSDQPGAPGSLNNSPSGGTPDLDANSGLPASAAPTPGPVMVLPDGRIVPATTTGIPAPTPGAAPATPGQLLPNGAPLPPGMAVQQPNTPPLPGQVGQPSNAAVGLINQILTTPRPGGFNGLQGGQMVDAQGNPVPSAPGTAPGVVVGVPRPAGGGAAPAMPAQQVIGAGLAGVASKREQEGIKEYNKRTAYNEWEFVYDISKDPLRRGAMGATGAQGGTGRANIPATAPIMPPGVPTPVRPAGQ
jgi:hypothetical protein